MTILYSDDSGPILWPEEDSHDIDSQKYYDITYRPPFRQDETSYVKSDSVVIPLVRNGCMYECVSGGISDTTPPVFSTIENGTIDDGDVKWKCKVLKSKMDYGDVITDSEWIAESWITLENPLILADSTTAIQVTSITPPEGITSFKITNRITILRASSREEVFDKSIIIPIKVL
jgi:hypothetical protein